MDKILRITLKVDAKTGEITTVRNSFDKLDKSVAKSKANINTFGGAMNSANDSLTRFAKQIAWVYVIDKAFDVLVKHGIEYVSQMEQTKIGIASLIAINSQNTTAMGKTITEEQKYIMAKQQSLEVIKMLRKANLETPATLQQLTQGYQSAIGPLLRYGASQKQSIKYVTQMTQAAAAMGVPMDMLAQEMRSVISADIDRNSIVATNLGLTNEQIKLHKRQGDLMEWLEKKLNAFSLAGKDITGSWQGVTSNLEDTLDVVSSMSVTPLMDSMKRDMTSFNEWLMDDSLSTSTTILNLVNDASESNLTNAEAIGLAISKIFYLAYEGFNIAFSAINTGFNLAVNGWITIINYFVKAWDWAGVNIQNSFKFVVEIIGTMWNKVINFMIDGLNRLASGAIFGGLGQAFELIGEKNPFKIINVQLGKFDSGIKIAKMSTKDFIEGFNLEDENKKAWESLDNTFNSAVSGYNKIGIAAKSNKKNGDSLVGGLGDVGDAAEKAGGKGKKGHDAAAQAAREQEKILKELQESYSKYTDIVGTSWDKFQEKLIKTMQELKNLPVDMGFEVKEKMTGEYEDTWMLKYYDEIGDKVGALKIKQRQVLEDLKGTKLPGIDIGKVEASQYEEMAKLMKEQSKSFYETLEDLAEKGNFGAILATKIMDSLEGLADSIRSGDMSSVGDSIGNVITSSANAFLPGLGTAIDLIGAIFSDIVSQSEIDAAKGRSDYSDNSISNSLSRLGDTAYPMLDATQKMSKYLRSMENNFDSVARAITGKASSAGIDLTGANYVNTSKVGFLGFSSKSVSLIGTGLQFQVETFENMMGNLSDIVQGYTSSLIQKSSWFGLKTKTYISTKYKDLPDSILNDISNAFSDGYNAILTAGVSLGFNKDNIAEILERATINLGKIDFTGLSSSEVSERLSSALGEALSGVVNNVSDFSTLIDRYNKSTENSLETLVRIATEYDQAVHQFNLIDKKFVNGLYSTQMQVLDIVESTGGMDNFNDAMSTFMGNFYTDAEQLGFMTESMSVAFNTLHVSMPKTKAEFRNLLETMDTSTEAGSYLYGQILLLSDSFNEMSTASENLKTSMSDSLQSILDAFTGELSYLTLSQKAEYASRYYKLAGQSNSLIDSVEAARVQAETAIKTASTREEYIPIFDKYVKELEKQAKDATNTDLLNALKAIKDEIIISRNEQTRTSIYTKASA